MALQYLFDPNKQFQSLGGVNEVGGFLRVFLNGTDDRATTYRNFDGGLNEPDIVLDTYGRAVVIVDDTKTYRIEVYNRLGGLMWTVSSYKASGGSGGGSGTPVSVEGTVGEIDVYENTEGGVKYFVVGLAQAIKNSLTSLASSVTYLASGLAGKKDRQSPVSVSGGTTKTLVGISQDADGAMTPEFDDIAFPDYSQRFENIENEQTVDAKVIAAALNNLNARMEAVEDSQGEKNIGDRIADSLDSQNLFEGGIRVKVRQPVKNFFGSATKTVTGLSQDANGEMTPTFSDIDFDSKVLSFYPQSLGYMTPDERAALNAKMQEVANNGGMIILWDGLGANFPSVLYYYDSSEYRFYRIEKYGNNIEYHESNVTYNSGTKTFNVDDSLTIIDPTLYEKIANKKTTITGNESSTTYYPNMKAVVDYINGVMQNLGGKLITDNGAPFSDSVDLPSSTPYNGIAIQDKDYAYVQGTGTAERWSATVTGSSVSWVNEYTINIPVFTPSQQAIIDGDSSDMTATFSTASTRANISTGEKLSVLFGKIAKWFADLKAVAFTGNYSDLSGTPTIPEAATSTPQPVSSSAGSTGSSDYFAKGDHVHKIVVGEGVNNGQVSIAGTSVSVKGWDTKQDALPVGTTPIDTYSINISGMAGRANNATNDSQGYNIYQTYMRTSAGTKSLSFGSTTIIGSVNGSNVVLSMPQANFISKDLDLASIFSLSLCQFICHESVPPAGTWHRYAGTDVCDAFKTQIGIDWGISATDYDGKANKATNDALGNNIVTTYATKTELSDTATGLGNSLSSAVNGIYDSMNKGCVRSAFDYESIAGKFTDVFYVKRESTSYVDAVVRLKVWGKYQYISATNDHTFCADITVQIRGESGSSNWTSAIADGCILYKGSTSSVSDLRVKMTTDSDNRLYISILAANATESYTRMIVESNFMTNNQERVTPRNLVSIYGAGPAGRSAIGAEFSLT